MRETQAGLNLEQTVLRAAGLRQRVPIAHRLLLETTAGNAWYLQGCLIQTSPLSLLGRAVAPVDKTGFWSNILQKTAGLQPLKLFLMESQHAQHAISSWTFCHRAEYRHMWEGGPNNHRGTPLPKVKPVKHISPARHDNMTCIEWVVLRLGSNLLPCSQGWGQAHELRSQLGNTAVDIFPKGLRAMAYGTGSSCQCVSIADTGVTTSRSTCRLDARLHHFWWLNRN